jgi:predicted small lipoprotein YifL
LEENIKMKHSLYKWFLLLALVVPLALTACGQDLEQAVEDAARQVEEAATQAAPQIDEAATRAAEALAEAQQAAEEAMDEAMDEEEMDEPDEIGMNR